MHSAAQHQAPACSAAARAQPLLLCSALQYSSLTGKALGAALLVAGVLGWLGGRTKSANATNLQLILSVVGIMLALQYVGEVVKDTNMDCALAELYYQNVGTRKELAALKNAGTINAVFNRLNELEDMLTLAQQVRTELAMPGLFFQGGGY